MTYSIAWRIRILGQVQGVGFRPFVWKKAVERGLSGHVSNGMAGVEVIVNASIFQIEAFYRELIEEAPAGSRITSSTLELLDPFGVDVVAFTIIESVSEGAPVLLLTPDVALCPVCREELHSSGNRRLDYPFITCTYCGPRYSVIQALPYDRGKTTMRPFEMCPDCHAEYQNPADRRFFAQTNSCPTCGIRMELTAVDGAVLGTETAFIVKKTTELWSSGAIIAIKGIGGYLLTCDATNAEAVARLRARKHRPTKPFAIMYPQLAAIQGDVRADKKAIKALESPAAPIVLLEKKGKMASGLAVSAVAPGLDKIGVMLPYAPLFELLLAAFNRPIVATSGNVSGMPIVYETDQIGTLSAVADYILSHNRDIATPQDDSVLAFGGKIPVYLRRSRGLAPTLLIPDLKASGASVVALGAEMKGTFTVTYSEHFFVSQYWGDLSDYDTQQRYELMLRQTMAIFKIKPTVVLGDLHPAYFTSGLGHQLANEWSVPFVQVQHHEAHFAAVLAENGLLKSPEPILGVIWDGTGLGHDGQIWGGEFLVFEHQKMHRRAHLPYFPLLLGDKMPREPRISALALFGELPDAEPLLQPKFSEKEWALYPRLRAAHAGVHTSSMGRVFDAVASLLGLADTVSYEGEAALRLEVAARQYFRKNGLDAFKEEAILFNLMAPDWKMQFVTAITSGVPIEHIAALFHYSLVELIAQTAEQQALRHIAFSGGVFQNTLLVELINHHLGKRFDLYFHQQLSPNDECVSFGQYFLMMSDE